MAKRIVGLDMFRGFMIFYVILLHPLLQRVFAQDSSEFGNQMTILPLPIVILGIPLFILALWGTSFTLMSGVATAYQITQKMSIEPSNIQLKKALNNKIITSALVLVFHWIFLLFFSNRSPDFNTTSLFTGYFEAGSLDEFSVWQLLTGGTLETIAFTGLFISILLNYLWRDGKFNSQRAIKILLEIGFSVVILTVIFESILPDPWMITNQLFEEGKIITGFIYMRLFAVRFSLFPMLAFASFGAAFGIKLARGVSVKHLLKISLVLLSMGIVIALGYFISGYDILTHFAEEHTPIMMQVLNLGLQLVVLTCLIGFFDRKGKGVLGNIQQSKVVRNIKKMLSRYNSNSLTIFVIEPFFSIIIFRLMGLWYQARFSTNWGVIILYEAIVILIWFVGLRKYEQIGFKYNCEWFISYIKRKIIQFNKIINDIRKINIESVPMLVQIPQ